MMVNKITSTLIASFVVSAGSISFSPLEANAFSLFINPMFGSTENTGSTARLDFENFSSNAGEISFDLKLTNTTQNPPATSTFVGASFDLPNYTPGSNFASLTYDPNGTAFEDLWGPNGASLNLGGGPNLYDIGIRSVQNPNGVVSVQNNASQFNGGNPQGGLTNGQMATVKFSVPSALTPAQFEQALMQGYNNGTLLAAGRFQQVNSSQTGATSDKVGAAVPEPLTILGSALAIGFGALFKKKRLSQ